MGAGKKYFRTRWPWHRSLGGKFILLTVTVLALTMSVIAIVNFHLRHALYEEYLNEEVTELGQFVARVSAEAILSYDYVALDEHMRDISDNASIVYAAVISHDGHNLTTHLNEGDPRVLQAIEEADSTSFFAWLAAIDAQPGVSVMEFPITLKNRTLGSVRVGVSRAKIERQLDEELFRQFLGNGFIIVFLAACIFVVFRYNTLRPIIYLVRGARRVAAGNLNEPVQVFSDDELGKLTCSFNEMMAKLKASNEEKDRVLSQLQDLNRNLEERVESRTRELERVNHELEHLALYDVLTGLPNRSLIQDRLQQCVFDARRNGQIFGVMMLDLDRFKEVNDTLGHDCGDALLVEVGQRFSDALRERDTLGRLGGDEFAVILPEADIDACVTVCGKLIKSLESAFELEGMNLSVSASIGIALCPEHGADPSSLLKAADLAMYAAKTNKQNYCVYNEKLAHRDPAALGLMGELREAITNEHLQLHFQPKIDVQQQRVIGAEALVRWSSRTRAIPPDEFIPVAEQTGLIRPLTDWVILAGFRQWAAWHDLGLDLNLSINLSMYNLQDDALPARIAALREQWNVNAARITFEITESAIMQNPDQTMAILRELHGMEFKLSVDDFGTGYSSLSLLKRLPVSELKVDRAFVRDMATDSDDAAIVRAIIDLARNLGLQVVAEGVEDEHSLRALAILSCEYAQGYFISRPVCGEEFLLFLQAEGPFTGTQATPVAETKVESARRSRKKRA